MRIYSSHARDPQKDYKLISLHNHGGQQAVRWHMQVLKEENCQPRILYLIKISCKNEGEIKTFPNEKIKGSLSAVVQPCKKCSLSILIAQLVKNLPVMQDTGVQFLGWEDPLEKEMTNHSSILAWRIPWTEEPGRLQSMGSQESDMT